MVLLIDSYWKKAICTISCLRQNQTCFCDLLVKKSSNYFTNRYRFIWLNLNFVARIYLINHV